MPNGARPTVTTIITLWHTDSPRSSRVALCYWFNEKKERIYDVGILRDEDRHAENWGHGTDFSLPEAYRFALLLVEALNRSPGLSNREISWRCRIAACPDEFLNAKGMGEVRWVEAVIGEVRCREIRSLLLPQMPREIRVLAQEDINKMLERRHTRRGR